ncbi:MFS general substrate transporter [Basidiobolus meristosporus CBS 931.73]|uniref:MFS general substrate transporter n=1 Tax=Basidiobolus meristosporus CBS 931.73 TaxID=1314790 RepID=A0A1Y1YM39_9FUNG|nr:MFS general substrate transporter [Basidiobolus meristosporus CBS 931.73]|eukprot:ORX99072.1 MFS general substrate transporter [Basidiobolus meristosporus CBS 931.73]
MVNFKYDLSALRIGNIRYNSPMTQVLFIGFVCFCCPGMFNCINGMGAGGEENGTTAKNGNVALYTTFAIFGVFGGAFYNLLGVRLCVLLGGGCYALYTGSMLYLKEHSVGTWNSVGSQVFVIVASAILGIGAGILWTAEGVIMMSYPPEDEKGRCVAYFWIIFNLGGVMGAFIPFGLNFHNSGSGVNSATYIAFLSIMCIGALFGLLLLPPEKVIRNDGSRVQVEKFQNVWTEAKQILLLFKDKNMLLLTPISLASNWFYSYQFGDINGVLFNLRTRSFNNAFYWAFQMLGAFLLGMFLDSKSFSRRTRALYGLYGVFAVIMIVWGGGLALQLQYTREDIARHRPDIDFIKNAGSFWPKWVLYSCYGLLDAATQSYAYWIMGTMTNDSTTLARYGGYYKGIQSAGGAISWRIDAIGTSYLVEFIICWALLILCFPFTWVIAKNVKETCNDDDMEKQDDMKLPAQ